MNSFFIQLLIFNCPRFNQKEPLQADFYVFFFTVNFIEI